MPPCRVRSSLLSPAGAHSFLSRTGETLVLRRRRVCTAEGLQPPSPAGWTRAAAPNSTATARRSTGGAPPPSVVVLSSADNPALAHAPLDAAELLIGHDLESLLAHGDKLRRAEALLWVPPTPPPVLRALLVEGHAPAVRWCHGFYAGVDPIAAIAREVLLPAGIPLSNGRGAFSSSLAEYALMAALHFNKQVARCQQNRRERRWDKFEMSVLRGQTLGLLGFGDIAQHVARLGKAFGMRVVCLRPRLPTRSSPLYTVVGPVISQSAVRAPV